MLPRIRMISDHHKASLVKNVGHNYRKHVYCWPPRVFFKFVIKLIPTHWHHNTLLPCLSYIHYIAFWISCQTDDVIKPEKEVTVDDDVKCQLPVSDVKQSEDCANQVSRPEVKDELTAVHPTDTTRIPEVVARHGDNMVLPEVSSLGDREPVVMSPLSHQDVFSSRTCALVPRTTQLAHRVGPFHRHVPPYRVMASAVRPPCSDRLPRLLRYPPPPPPPPPLPSHLMRLFATSSDSKSTCSRPSTSLANTGGRPVRFPRMGHTGLATNSSHRMTLQVVRPDHFQL